MPGRRSSSTRTGWRPTASSVTRTAPIDDRDFTDDSVDAGAIGAGHEVTALYAVRLREDAREGDHLADVRLRWTDPESGDSDELRQEVRIDDLAPRFGSTDPTFRLDTLVAATAEILRDSPWLRGVALSDVARVADQEIHELPATDATHDFLDLLDELTRLEE